jgi:lysozyme
MYRQRDRQVRAREPQQVSKAGLEMLVREEGVRRFAYNDPAGHATFGVGHLLHRGNVTSADSAKWGTPGNPKPMSVVFDVLESDLDAFEAAVRESVKVKVSGNEFDALVSLAFNIGINGFRGSTVVRRLNAGDRRGAADAFRMWANPSMLKARRERERALFLRK